MTRPVTLFTGQWADLSLEELAKEAASWGYDGLGLACWGDHFEVEKALENYNYCKSKREMLTKLDLEVFAISTHLTEQEVNKKNDKYNKTIKWGCKPKWEYKLKNERRYPTVEDLLVEGNTISMEGVSLCLGYKNTYNECDIVKSKWGKCGFLGEIPCFGCPSVYRKKVYERKQCGMGELYSMYDTFIDYIDYGTNYCSKSPWLDKECPYYKHCLAAKVKRDLLGKEQNNGSYKNLLCSRSLGMFESVLGPSRDTRPYPSYVFW